MEQAKPFEETKSYRIHAQYKNWIGKPDPSGFGDYFIYSDDPSWIHEEVQRRVKNGDKILSIQKRKGKRWIKI